MNLKDFNNGRMAGLEMALRIVKEGGVDALEKEIRFRGATGLNTALTAKQVDAASENIKAMCFDAYLTMGIWTLHNAPFHFGQVRCQRFQDSFTHHKCLASELVTWPDITAQIKEEIGLELEIRENNGE